MFAYPADGTLRAVAGPARRMLPMRSAEDVGAALAFYGGLLGGEVVHRSPGDDPVLLTLRLGESETASAG
jgi:hypothetical protein